VASWQAHFLKFTGSLGVQPAPDVLDSLLQQAVHLAPFFGTMEASMVMKAVTDWGAGATTHGAALAARLPPAPVVRAPPPPSSSSAWPGYAASYNHGAYSYAPHPHANSSGADAAQQQSRSWVAALAQCGSLPDLHALSARAAEFTHEHVVLALQVSLKSFMSRISFISSPLWTPEVYGPTS